MSTVNIASGELAGLLADAGLDTVEGAFACHRGHDLCKPGLGARRRTRITLTGPDGKPHQLYLKRYGPLRFRDRLRRLITLGPVSPAAAEFENILAAGRAGVPTMDAIAWGQETGLPLLAARRSYLVVSSVPGDAIERCGEEFLASRPDAAEQLTDRLAQLVAALHAAGYVHRDLYASHVFLDASGDEVSLYLIDLARMFAPLRRKFRWRVKDLAQLKYSMPPPWVEACWDGFLDAYLARCPGRRDRCDRAIDRKVTAMRLRARRHALRDEKGAPT